MSVNLSLDFYSAYLFITCSRSNLKQALDQAFLAHWLLLILLNKNNGLESFLKQVSEYDFVPLIF